MYDYHLQCRVEKTRVSSAATGPLRTTYDNPTLDMSFQITHEFESATCLVFIRYIRHLSNISSYLNCTNRIYEMRQT